MRFYITRVPSLVLLLAAWGIFVHADREENDVSLTVMLSFFSFVLVLQGAFFTHTLLTPAFSTCCITLLLVLKIVYLANLHGAEAGFKCLVVSYSWLFVTYFPCVRIGNKYRHQDWIASFQPGWTSDKANWWIKPWAGNQLSKSLYRKVFKLWKRSE